MDDTIPMEAAHGAGAAFVCEECDKSFSKQTSLRSHRASVHSGKPPGRPGPRKDRQPAAPKPAASRGRRRSLKADLEVSYRFLFQLWAMRDPYCGTVAMGQAGQIAEAWDSWAASSPKVQAAIERFLAGSGALGVGLAHIPIVIAVTQHHGPQSAVYFPPAPAPEEAAANGAGPEPGPEPAWANAGPVASGYEPASADRSRD